MLAVGEIQLGNRRYGGEWLQNSGDAVERRYAATFFSATLSATFVVPPQLEMEKAFVR
jgi:hypothetical protein